MTELLLAFYPARGDAETAAERLVARGTPEAALALWPKQVRALRDVGVVPRSSAARFGLVGALALGAPAAVLAAVFAGASVVVPGLDAVFAGPLVAAAAGFGAFGAAGLAAGALVGSRRVRFEADVASDAVRATGGLLTVRCERADEPEVTRVLRAVGACSITRRRG